MFGWAYKFLGLARIILIHQVDNYWANYQMPPFTQFCPEENMRGAINSQNKQPMTANISIAFNSALIVLDKSYIPNPHISPLSTAPITLQSSFHLPELDQ